jgi:general secretion pathway protein K
MESVPELALIVNADVYSVLSPYVTAFGDGDVNINTASSPVLMSLSDNISEEMAERVITYRERQKFENKGELVNAGFETALTAEFIDRITVDPSAYSVRAVAGEQGIKRIIEAVMDSTGNVLYWREY